MGIDQIAEGRRTEIAAEFDELLSEGKDTEEAARLLGQKYNISTEDVEQIVRGERSEFEEASSEENGDDEPDKPDDPDTGRAA